MLISQAVFGPVLSARLKIRGPLRAGYYELVKQRLIATGHLDYLSAFLWHWLNSLIFLIELKAPTV
ncbi:hypothetical protein SNK12g_16320 [Lactiplantibacillus plantarum]